MSSSSVEKILLVQLPYPAFDMRSTWGDVPLAAGFLKAMAHDRGLLDEVDIEIVDSTGGGGTSLVFDATDSPVVSYAGGCSQSLRLAVRPVARTPSANNWRRAST